MDIVHRPKGCVINIYPTPFSVYTVHCIYMVNQIPSGYLTYYSYGKWSIFRGFMVIYLIFHGYLKYPL